MKNNFKKKLNVGAGFSWYEKGWETLDNAPNHDFKKKSGNILENVGIQN